ncbi:MAG: type II secretion system F family protein [Sulfurospirillaceae bacterium]|nr:type II secretion system F family protein [Sulfurospirillaceae bacterium]
MKYFEIEYIKAGNREKIVIPSAHKIEAIKEFQAKSLGFMVQVEEISEPFSYKLEAFKLKLKTLMSAKKIPLEPYIAALQQIAVMLNAGLPINTCLKDVIKTSENKRIKEIFSIVLLEVESGTSVSISMKQFSDEVGNISIAMLDLGEKTGSLDESIKKLAEILQEVHDNRMKLKKATRYPVTVLFAMVIAFSFVITLVIPQFQAMFAEYRTTLPFPTLVLLWIESAIRHYGLFVLVGAMMLGFGLSIAYKKSLKFKHIFDRYMLKVYIVGKVIYLSMIGRFIYVFDRLVSSGIPLVESLKTSIDIVENSYLRERLNEIINAIEEGKSLTNGFEDTKQFESMIIQMISAGETSGSLNNMLEKITTIYRNKYSYLVDNVSVMIEPLLIAGIAGFVMLLALGIFLPMWSIAEAVGGV